LAGFPGSAHDNRIYQNNVLYQNPNMYFAKNQFVVGDCAFDNTNTMVTSFKKLAKQTLPDDQAYMGRLGITLENTIGMLKGCFQFLHSIAMLITNNPNLLRHILRVIDC
jgi:DDE superfamily endonuclease